MAKVKIPKRVAGMKVPKKVRKKAKKALKAAESPAIQQFAAAAIGAATRSRTRSFGLDRQVATESRIVVDGDRLAETIRTAALDGIRRFLEGFEEGLRDLARDAAGEPEKPARRSRTATGPAAGTAAE